MMWYYFSLTSDGCGSFISFSLYLKNPQKQYHPHSRFFKTIGRNHLLNSPMPSTPHESKPKLPRLMVKITSFMIQHPYWFPLFLSHFENCVETRKSSQFSKLPSKNQQDQKAEVGSLQIIELKLVPCRSRDENLQTHSLCNHLFNL